MYERHGYISRLIYLGTGCVLIVPIPTLLLDILILFNIGIALIILFNAFIF